MIESICNGCQSEINVSSLKTRVLVRLKFLVHGFVKIKTSYEVTTKQK